MPTAATEHPRSTRRRAVLALLLATVFWGCGFTWARAGALAVADRAGMADTAAFPPIFLLGLRFAGAAAIWFLASQSARSGWSWHSLRQSLLVGIPLSLGLILQHIGLDWSSEFASAFLTSLTILFVPVITTLVFRQPPGKVLWIGVAVATGGVFLMTAATPSGFGLGEMLGLACALVFSWYILAVNAARESASRLVAGQFIITAIVCLAIAGMLPGRSVFVPGRFVHVLAAPAVWSNLLLLTVLTTVGGFALLTFFQPRLNPTQATLVYLCEPIFAAIYAAIAARHLPTRLGIVGAAMILSANVIVEILSGRSGKAVEPIVLD